jgi:Flp pilus assembly protein TadG
MALRTAANDTRRARRARGDRGASLVEFALVLPILALLMFGIIDFGTLYSDYQGLRNGTRDGTRNGAVANWGSTTNCVVGSIASPASKIMCDVKTKAGLGNNVRVAIWTPGGWTVGATLRVCAQYAMTSTTGFTSAFLNGKAMTAKVEFRIEYAMPAGNTWTAQQEAPITSWPSGCDNST